MKKTKMKIALVSLVASLGLGATSAFAAQFGTASVGASSTETAQLYYFGTVWVYPRESGYKQGSFKYSRGGKTLLTRKTTYFSNPSTVAKMTSSTATGGVWDSLNPFASKTTFSYNHTK